MKAILFDFDGVLADTFEFCYGIIKSFDASLTREEYRKRFLGNINEHEPGVSPTKKKDFDFFALYTPKLLATTIDPEIKDVLRELSKNYSLFIVSSTNTEPIRKFLERHKLDHYFKEIYGNDIHKSKIEKIKMIFEKYALVPSSCMFVTDTVGDIKEARECGVDSIAVSWGYHERAMLAEGKPLTVVGSVKDLISSIRQFSIE